QLALPNLTNFVVSNRCYGSTSEVPVPNAGLSDYAAAARGFGGGPVSRFDSLDTLRDGFDEAVIAPGYTFVILEVEPAGMRLEEPPIEGPEMKYRFGRHVERAAGVRVFDFSITT